MQFSLRSKGGLLLSFLILVALAGAFLLGTLVQQSPASAASPIKNVVKFNLVPSPGITACLPKASGNVVISRSSLNDLMTVEVEGLAPNTGYDLFVTEIPNKPFGISWYQSDLQTNKQGKGSVSVRGIFNVETFSVSTGGPTTTF